jgi:ribosomal protein S18 acetylase RimI-like enzyme
MSSVAVTIVQALPENDFTIAQHFYQLWLDNGISEDSIRDDWLEITLKFIKQARSEVAFQAFVAEIDGSIVGSASCQLYGGLYPSPFKLQHRHYGYIWNIYVKSDYRRQGIATQLTKTAIDYLKDLDCTKVVLHASPFGKPVYESLGFVSNNEMVLDLKKV